MKYNTVEIGALSRVILKFTVEISYFRVLGSPLIRSWIISKGVMTLENF